MNHHETYDPAPNALDIAETATFIADTLIAELQESNGLDTMPPEQRLALIYELCKPCLALHDEIPLHEDVLKCYKELNHLYQYLRV